MRTVKFFKEVDGAIIRTAIVEVELTATEDDIYDLFFEWLGLGFGYWKEI